MTISDGWYVRAEPLLSFLDRRIAMYDNKSDFLNQFDATTRQNIYRYMKNPPEVLDIRMADRICIQMGLHPTCVYGREWDHYDEEAAS